MHIFLFKEKGELREQVRRLGQHRLTGWFILSLNDNQFYLDHIRFWDAGPLFNTGPESTQSLTYSDSNYDFSIFQWCKVICIQKKLNFELWSFPGLAMTKLSPSPNTGQWKQAKVSSQSHDHRVNSQNSPVYCVARLWCSADLAY